MPRHRDSRAWCLPPGNPQSGCRERHNPSILPRPVAATSSGSQGSHIPYPGHLLPAHHPYPWSPAFPEGPEATFLHPSLALPKSCHGPHCLQAGALGPQCPACQRLPPRPASSPSPPPILTSTRLLALLSTFTPACPSAPPPCRANSGFKPGTFSLHQALKEPSKPPDGVRGPSWESQDHPECISVQPRPLFGSLFSCVTPVGRGPCPSLHTRV